MANKKGTVKTGKYTFRFKTAKERLRDFRKGTKTVASKRRNKKGYFSVPLCKFID